MKNIELFYKTSNTKSHYEFEQYLRNITTEPKERNRFYKGLEEGGIDLSTDSFREYFEEYAAERKTNAQDYTPKELAELMAKVLITDSKDDPKTIYDGAAGTGALLIAAWNELGRSKDIEILAGEYGDNAIPYLIHNLNMRELNATVIQIDTLERVAKQVYILRSGEINILPHSEKVAQEFDIREWDQEEKTYFETEEVREEYAED